MTDSTLTQVLARCNNINLINDLRPIRIISCTANNGARFRADQLPLEKYIIPERFFLLNRFKVTIRQICRSGSVNLGINTMQCNYLKTLKLCDFVLEPQTKILVNLQRFFTSTDILWQLV